MLNTDRFTIPEVELLIEMLAKNFMLTGHAQFHGDGQLRIRLRLKDYPTLYDLTADHIHSDMHNLLIHPTNR